MFGSSCRLYITKHKILRKRIRNIMKIPAIGWFTNVGGNPPYTMTFTSKANVFGKL